MYQRVSNEFSYRLDGRLLRLRTVVKTGMRLTAEACVQLRAGLCGMYSGQSLKRTGLSPSNPVLPLVLFPPLYLLINLPPGEKSMDPLRVIVPHIKIHGLASP